MLFDDGTVLVTSDIDTDMGKAEWFQEQLEKASSAIIIIQLVGYVMLMASILQFS